MSIYYIIGALFGLQFVILVMYSMSRKKKELRKHEDINIRLYPIYNNPNIVKVALWVNLDSVNGKPLDESFVYYTNLKNGILNPNKVEVALFNPGVYNFTVSSNSRAEYQHVEMQVKLEPGVTYQLGCNESGPYFVPDPNPERYQLKVHVRAV